MDFNKEVMINDDSELEEEKDYELIFSHKYTGIYTYTDCFIFKTSVFTFKEYIFINSVYEIKLYKPSYNFICTRVKNLLTNEIKFIHNICNIFKIPTNEYVLK